MFIKIYETNEMLCIAYNIYMYIVHCAGLAHTKLLQKEKKQTNKLNILKTSTEKNGIKLVRRKYEIIHLSACHRYRRKNFDLNWLQNIRMRMNKQFQYKYNSFDFSFTFLISIKNSIPNSNHLINITFGSHYVSILSVSRHEISV